MNKLAVLLSYSLVSFIYISLKITIVILAFIIGDKNEGWITEDHVKFFVLLCMIIYTILFMIDIGICLNIMKNIYEKYPNYNKIIFSEPFITLGNVCLIWILSSIFNIPIPESDVELTFYILSIYIAPIISFISGIFSFSRIICDDCQKLIKFGSTRDPI